MPLDKVTVRPERKTVKTVRESYVKRLRDNYLLILRTLMHDLIVSVDKDGNFVFVNDAAVEFWGKPRKKIIGTHFIEYLQPDDIERSVAALQDLIKKKNQVKSFMTRMKSPRGFRNVAWNGVAVFDDEGNYVGTQATGKDLTNLLQAEDKLRASEERFKSFIDNAPEAIWVQDVLGNFIAVNKKGEKLTGYKRDELLGKNLLELLVPPESVPLVMEAFKATMLGETSGPVELEMLRKDGSLVSVEASTIPVERDGKIEIIGIARDITDRKNVEQKLKASEERYRRQFEEAMDAIFLVDAQTGLVVDCNLAATKLLGRTKSEMIGKSPQIFHPQEKSAGEFGRAFRQRMKEKMGQLLEVPIITKNGEIRIAAIRANLIELGDTKIVQAIFRDITDRKKTEDSLRESEKRFRELSELLPEIVFEADTTGVLTFANQVAFDRFGYSQEDFDNGLNSLQMLVPEDRDRAKTAIATALSGTDVGFVEYTALDLSRN